MENIIKKWELLIEITDDGENDDGEKGEAYYVEDEITDMLCPDMPAGMELTIISIREIKK